MGAQIFDAGHMVPMDQPKAALEMINHFLSGKSHEAQAAGSLLRPAASVNQTVITSAAATAA